MSKISAAQSLVQVLEAEAFAYSRLNIDAFEQRRCVGVKRGLCKFCGERHVELRGTLNGVWRTKVAEPYPRPLCRYLARAFYGAIASERAESFMSKAAKPGTKYV